MKTIGCKAIRVLAGAVSLAQQRIVPPSQKKIDQAILRGSDSLRNPPSPGGHLNSDCDESPALGRLGLGRTGAVRLYDWQKFGDR